MPDIYDKATRSRVMASIRGQDTKPEMYVRRLLHRMGYRFRLHRKDLPGNPDIVLPGRRAVILVHGCFWHQHPGCKRAARPDSNQDFWDKKLDRNVRRDQENISKLERLGWRVLIIWECEMVDEASLEIKLREFLER